MVDKESLVQKEKKGDDEIITTNESSRDYENKIELKNKNIICYIRVKDNFIKSEELCELINKQEIKGIDIDPDKTGKFWVQENKHIFIVFPSFKKKIKIIDSKGKKYKSTICFAEDVKSIIGYFKMKNPHYYDEKKGKYIKFLPEYYSEFLLGKNIKIKDITYSEINYSKLKEKFLQKEINIPKKTNISFLKEISDNIDYYTRISVKDEKIFFTKERFHFRQIIYNYYTLNKKKIHGIYGNYSSGKTISLLVFNYSFDFPTLYLNLKVLKNSFLTDGYTTILPEESINIFVKNKKQYEEYEKFIEKIYKTEYDSFDKFIISIISYFLEWEAMIFLDQYSHELFRNEFIDELKNKIYSENSKLKLILINSMNDKWIRNIYVKCILNYFDNNDMDEEIDFLFLDKLIKKENLLDEKIDENILQYLQLFDYLPLYYSYVINNEKNIDEIKFEEKEHIMENIEKFFKKNSYEDNLIQINEIRIKINEEIDKKFFQDYNHIIPFKYFYIETICKNDQRKAFLKCHFPFIKEVWNEIIYNRTLKLFDGEINYTGKVIGSFLELNFVNQCKKDKFGLDVDCFVELDTLLDMNKITNKNATNLENKNILIIQKNECAPLFDVGFLRAKNTLSPEMSYIQIKKNSTENKVRRFETNDTFQRNLNKFVQLFKIKPVSCYLIYITLINKFIEENITLNSQSKQKKDNDINLNDKSIDMIKRINSLDDFCKKENIVLYYFNPSKSKFYTRQNDKFTESNLDLFQNISLVTESVKIKAEFLNKKKERQLGDNVDLVLKYNQKIFSKNLKESDYVLEVQNNKLDLRNVIKFIKENCEEGTIKTFLLLEKENESTMRYYRKDKIIILCLCKSKNYDYLIKSVIYKDNIFDYKNIQNKKFIDSFEIDVKDYDLLVWIQFKNFKTRGKIYEYH